MVEIFPWAQLDIPFYLVAIFVVQEKCEYVSSLISLLVRIGTSCFPSPGAKAISGSTSHADGISDIIVISTDDALDWKKGSSCNSSSNADPILTSMCSSGHLSNLE